MTAGRSSYAGVLDIVRFNAGLYAGSGCLLVAVGLLLWLSRLPWPGQYALIGVAVATAYWSIASILASYYIYDYANVTGWEWLAHKMLFPPQRWVNIHAGLDSSTAALGALFPLSEYAVLDLYDPEEMTEPSIARARRMHLSHVPAVAASVDALPLPDADRDAVFLLFAAHEVRVRPQRMKLVQEVARVLRASGQFILVEHVRDWKNFFVFGPGFLHFYSRSEWLRVTRSAGLTLQREGSMTPFVRYFVLTKAGP